MKRSSTLFLQFVVVLVGVGTLTFLLWEPHLEGRNKNATPFEVYFKDPFLAYVYISSIPYFIALHQAFKVLGYAGQNKIFSPPAVKALRTMKHCAVAIIGLVAVSAILFVDTDPDDRPVGIVMRLVVTFLSIIVATAAAMFERVLQNAVDLKSENDLTV